MKYVCERCGTQLRVDRDIDDDGYFEVIRYQHVVQECPNGFAEPLPVRTRAPKTVPAQNSRR